VECHGYHARGGHASPWPPRTLAAGPQPRPGAAALRARLVEFLTAADRRPGER